MAEQAPSVGRIVHFIDKAGRHIPAVIVDPEPKQPPGKKGFIHLTVFGFNDQPALMVKAAEGTDPGTWHWPEYVPPPKAPKPGKEGEANG
jgi:hypothetical protein